METRRLNAFIKIVDSGSMTRAANFLGVAQPALSQQVVDLEHQFGVKLLNRSNQGVTPTPAGLRLYRHAQVILQQLEIATRDVSQGIDGAVRIGIVGTYAGMILPEFLKRAKARYPSIDVSVWEGMTVQIVERTASASLDVGVVIGKPSVPGIKSRQLISEHVYLVSAADCPAPVAGETVEIPALAQVPLVVPNEGSAQRRLIDYAFTRHGLRPTVAVEVGSLSGALSAVKANIGSAILTASAVANYPDSLRLQLIDDLARTVSVITTADSRAEPSPAELMAQLLGEIMSELVESGHWPFAEMLATASDPKSGEPHGGDADRPTP